MKKKKKKSKKGIPLIILIVSVIAIIVIIFICLIVYFRRDKIVLNKEISVTEQSMKYIEDNITTVEVINLVYGMDGCSVIEIPTDEKVEGLTVASGDETVATAVVDNNIVKLTAMSDEVGETTLNIKYNNTERNIPVYVKPSCLVKFNTDGGTSIIPQMVVYEGTVVRPEDPIKEGYEFIGWYKDDELTESYDFNSLVTSDMTIYANFQTI